MSKYPFVAGHEALGTIIDLGEQAKGLKIGQRSTSKGFSEIRN
jgi:alcohol/geraniol dehydrogenase (NADP+)